MPDEKEFAPDLVEVSDEEGNNYTFEILDRIRTDDAHYVALVPFVEDEDPLEAEPQELIVLRVSDDETYLEPIEDEAEFDRIAAAFEERLTAEFEFVDDEEVEEEE